MPSFEYEALDASGRPKRGVISADSARMARQELRSLLLTPVKISSLREDQQEARRAGPRKISSRDLAALTRQLSVLLGAATPLEEALNVIAQQYEKPHVRRRLMAVRERVMEGWRFSDALNEDPKSFPDVYRAVVASGETAGDMAGVLDRLATMLEKNQSMRGKAFGALIYPAALVVIAGGVVTALMTQVVPKIVDQFNGFDATLPLITRIVVSISDFISAYGLFILLAILLGAAALWQGLRQPAFKQAFDRRMLNLPVLGKLLRALDAARFARTLSTLFAGGAPLLDSLTGAARTVSNAYMRAQLEESVTSVGEGASLSAALKRTKVLPPVMAPMIAAGERAGALPVLLDKTAAQLEEEFDSAANTALRLLEPAIIAILGVIILVIVVSIMLPILRLNSLAAG